MKRKIDRERGRERQMIINREDGKFNKGERERERQRDRDRDRDRDTERVRQTGR